MDQLTELLPFLVPFIIIQLILITVALLDLSKQRATRGPKWLWVAIIVLINFIGPIVYFVLGREDV